MRRKTCIIPLSGGESLEPVSRFVKAQGINHHYFDWGNSTAPPLLLLHAVGLCASTWNSAAKALSEDFHVMCFDHRGHGDTETTDQNLTFHQAGEDLAEIIRQMDLEGVDTVGHSLGGMATLIADSIQPGIIGRSVIIESRVGPRPASAPSQDLQERAKRAAMKRSIWENRETMYEAYRNRPVFKNWTDEVFGDFIQGGTRLLPDGRAELKCKPAVEASFYGQRDGVNDAVYIERLKGQYLLLLGDYPAGQKLEDVGVKDFLKVVPGSQVKAMGCGSHFLPMEYPDLVLGEIKGFFGS
jgi:pimeloyl-ACP methyl ester carboxylesterase